MTSGYTLRQRWYSQHPEHSGLWPRKGWQCLYPSFIHTGPAWWVAHSRGSGNSPSELTRTHTHTRPSTQESPFIYLPSGRLLCITSEFPPFSKSWFLCGMQAFRSCTSEFPKDMYDPLATRGRRRGSVRGHTSPPSTHSLLWKHGGMSNAGHGGSRSPRQLFIPRCGTGQTASVSPSMLHRADVGREVRHRCMTLRRPLSEGTTCLNRSQTLSHPSAMAKLMWTQLVPKSFQGCLKDCG